MKFTVSQSSLTQAIGVVMKGVASASTLDVYKRQSSLRSLVDIGEQNK